MLETVPEIQDVQNEPSSAEVSGSPSLLELAEVLDQHKVWVETDGESGVKADLCGVNLSNADLTGVNLQGAFLHKANLCGADLSMANLREANLVQADLRNTTLLGTELRGANLMGADVYGAEGLWVGRLGGTNLFDATLPESVAGFDSTKAIGEATKIARWFYFLTLGASVISCLLILFTTDVRLVMNASAFPLIRLGNILPMSGFYLGGPLLLLCLYLRFHFLVLRLWGSVAALPAVFPDGQTPERDGPWFLMGLIRSQVRWQRDSRSSLSMVETALSQVLGYWVVPATLFFYWLRYLVRQDFRGTLLHVLLITISVAAATSLPIIVSLVLRPESTKAPKPSNVIRAVFMATRAALAIGCLLFLFSLGVNRGLPADHDIAPERSSIGISRWAAQVFQSVGYRPYADITEAALSSPPAIWMEESLAAVPGARLNQVNLRFSRGYRVFLANAKLWRANLDGAYLSEADLRGANLREALLRSADLDRAQASHAVLVSANARGANLAFADLRSADLSYGMFQNADLSNTKLAGASLYAVNLQSARLLRTDLSRADLRDTKLEHAILPFANLQEADLSSAKLFEANLTGAQFKGAILLDAELKNVDLRGALMSGALLRGVVIDGAYLAGADLRGARGISSAQICSAHWQGALLDPELLAEVQTRCGTPPAIPAATPTAVTPTPVAPKN
ncbi:MAG TPA: pentapeptide repeat-containing protein [Candidatus Dormibacteraeota bacterium]|nr:pentapeptide repeat-containing protein [Candidatus Dormibacteraeota bacterium]